MKFEEVESLFESHELVLNFSERGKVLYLPPLERKSPFVPILSLYCKFNSSLSIAKLRTMLVCVDENHEKPYGIGFRMETQENVIQNGNETDDGGVHDFHHAQLIRAFNQRKLDKKLQIDSPSWLPESQPSFPLPADCPEKLLICLILTLYGMKYCRSFINAIELREIRQHFKELRSWVNRKQH